jgi:hypothetical protein
MRRLQRFMGVNCLVLLTICSGVAGKAQTASVSPRFFVPSTIDEALRELRHTQANEYDWRAFGPMSSSTVHNHGYKKELGSFDEESTMVLMDADGDSARFSFPGKDLPEIKGQLDEPYLDASNAKLTGEESVVIAGKSYPSRIFEFVKRQDILPGEALITTDRFWLVAGIPTGVARREWTRISEEGGIQKPLGTRTTRLVDLDVPFQVSGTVLHCYCYESELRWEGSEVEKSRECRNPNVPGGVVRRESVTNVKNVEVGKTINDLLEFEAHAPETSQPDRQETLDANCSLPASLLDRQGLEKNRAGDFQGAIEDFNAVLKVDPRCASTYNNRGQAKANLHDWAGAIADYDQAITLAPTLAAPYNNRGLVKAMRENNAAALQDYNRAIALKSDFAEAYANRAILHMAMFRDNDSRGDYLRAIKLKPEMQEQLDALIDRARRLRKR